MKHTTIKDVAKALNVSISTVSRAFNDKYDIHPDTRNKILEAARTMGYSPNPIAQKLCLHRSNMIGVIVPEFVNAFFPKVLMGIQKVMEEAGYQVLIMSSNESAQRELENIKTLVKNMVDGVIISLTQETRDISFFKELLERKFPIVQFNRVSQKLDTPKIIFDDYYWAYQATEHLISQGFQNIYHLSGPGNLLLTHNRIKGFMDALKKHHLDADKKRIVETGIFIEDGKRVAYELIEQGNIPEAFFCFNDPVAIGAMEVFKERGFKVPNQVAFIGFTESRIAMHMTPALSSVEQPSTLIGEKSAQVLLDILNGKDIHSSETITLSGKLNVRASSVREF